MPELRLPDHSAQVDLGKGYTLHTKGLRGTVRIEPAQAARALAADPLDGALERAGLRAGDVIALPPAQPAAAGTRDLAAGARPEAPSVALDVAVPSDESCVLLVEDTATGALAWVIPDAPQRETEGARAFATSLRFTIPLSSVAQAEGARAFPAIADLGKKVKTFFFKVTDAVLGPIIHGFAKKWETRHRPCFTRRLGPDDYRNDDPAFPRLTAADWRELAQGPALLFVHGTFSTSAAFRGLEPSAVAELSRRYGGRTFAFNHPTMTADPRENAIAFLSDIPAGLALEVDIVCHSRGGLVARQIAALGPITANLRVRRIVFVGATNAGTALADDDHMVDMVSRFTTITKFIPEGPAKVSVDALVLAVKVLGHGLLHDLEGLRAMNPRGSFMELMNVPGEATSEYFAIASDFEPKAGTPFISLARAEDLAVDSVFANAANDLVVPRDGVFASNGAGGFPIGDARCLKFGPADGVIHTEFFGEPRTGAKLLEWLDAASPDTRALASGASPVDMLRLLDTVRDRLHAELAASRSTRGPGARAPDDFTPAELDKLRPHVVNLSEGVFKQSGIYSTTEADVDAMVREHIPRWAAAQPDGEPLRVVVWAHGGLIGERDGLRIAQKHVEWWKRNGVYPIYFVWETGLFDALRSILEAVLRRLPGLGARDIFDFTSDPIVERGVRALGGVHIWGAMKRSAELASAADGGARYVAERLKELAADAQLRAGRELQLHAVGHSAGSIFHSWFVPAARQLDVPSFKTLQLLAPAITAAEFGARLAQGIGAGAAADAAILYTMKKHFEEDDDCIRVYRKSLLYLIHHALEPQARTPILGLEISLRADAALATLFGLNGAPNAPGRVVWSMTDEADGRFASRSTSHGGFDDDPATMNSVAANVLDEATARVHYTGDPAGARGFDGWPESSDWLAGVDLTSAFSASFGQAAAPASIASPPQRPSPAVGGKPSAPAPAPLPAPPAGGAAAGGAAGGGVRRALCVGIDAYPAPNTLSGCVGDTKEWKTALSALGFQVTPLVNEEATHAGIVEALKKLVSSSHSGDVLVFQYSGHGTQVPDTDGDEEDGSDEALVPVDFEGGAFLVDDDLRGLFEQLPPGVNLTCFIDCCHSGTITRMLGRNTAGDAPGTHTRYLKRTPSWDDWMRAHERFRQRERNLRTDRPDGRRALGANTLRWVNFSACDATEVAYESEGNGDFTRQATRLLSGDLLRGSNRNFQDAVIGAFGEHRRQTPQLDCADTALTLTLLQPLQ